MTVDILVLLINVMDGLMKSITEGILIFSL